MIINEVMSWEQSGRAEHYPLSFTTSGLKQKRHCCNLLFTTSQLQALCICSLWIHWWRGFTSDSVYSSCRVCALCLTLNDREGGRERERLAPGEDLRVTELVCSAEETQPDGFTHNVNESRGAAASHRKRFVTIPIFTAISHKLQTAFFSKCFKLRGSQSVNPIRMIDSCWIQRGTIRLKSANIIQWFLPDCKGEVETELTILNSDWKKSQSKSLNSKQMINKYSKSIELQHNVGAKISYVYS